MIQGYKQQGKTYFVHGNHNRKPSHTIDTKQKNLILDLYTNKYSDTNFTHFTELLEKHENITVSTSTINSILRQEFILSPKAKRATKKTVKKQLLELKKGTKSKKRNHSNT